MAAAQVKAVADLNKVVLFIEKSFRFDQVTLGSNPSQLGVTAHKVASKCF
jgi:hypothetical protein